MEEQLQALVREKGFVAVFESLKAIVQSEYERSKADFEFLQTLVSPKVEVPKVENEIVNTAVEAQKLEVAKDEEEARVLKIFDGPSVVRKRRVKGQ